MRRLWLLFTERDNATPDLKRVLWAVGVLWFMGCETYAVFKGQAFDPEHVALGLGGLIAAGGGALAMNRKNENGGDQ